MDDNNREAIKKLYPGVTDAQAAEIAEAFDRYLDFVVRTYERFESDPRRYGKAMRILQEEVKKNRYRSGGGLRERLPPSDS